MDENNYIITSFDPASTRNIGWSTAHLDGDPIKKTSNKKVSVEGWTCGTFVMPVVEDRWKVLWPMFVVVEAFLNEQEPDLIIVEKTSSFAGGFVTGQVAQCMGVLHAVCGKLEHELESVHPTTVKKTVAGHGRAKKPKVKKSVVALLVSLGIENVKFDSEHAADASANILCWLIKNETIAPLKEE